MRFGKRGNRCVIRSWRLGFVSGPAPARGRGGHSRRSSTKAAGAGESTGKCAHLIILRSLHVANRDDKHFWKKAYALHWGLPACFIFPFDQDLHQDYMAHRLDTKLFEGEWEFLVRHDLLRPEDSP